LISIFHLTILNPGSMETKMVKPRVHLICNAHLDPVWQWRWEEGCAEALATFRNAARLLDAYPDFIFNHNESLLYRWCERYDPVLFAHIQTLVREGRWFISGGWDLQPDANMPGLESFFRHIIEGRRYFLDRFGVTPRVAYNFDAFGHHGGLPQILRLCGYEMYIHLRPQAGEMELPSDLYRWRGVDGSEIPALRIAVGLYHTERDNIEKRLQEGVELALRLKRDVPVFWGLGNHGGGATRADLEKIKAFQEEEKRVRIQHSTPDRLLEALEEAAARAPVKEGDLQPVFTGCYTSLSRLKRRAQQSLAALIQAEALCTAAWWSKGASYPVKDLQGAWQDHLFNDFHDILPGTCTESAEQDALDLYGKAFETIRRLRLKAALAFNQGSMESPPLPLTVINMNPSLTRMPVEVEFMSDYRPPKKRIRHRLFSQREKTEIPCQEEQPDALLPFNEWRRKICFLADLPALGATHFQIEASEEKTENHADKRPALDCEIDPSSGLVRQINVPDNGPCLSGPLLQPFVVVDEGDAWGTGCMSYREGKAYFIPQKESVRIIQNGPIRTIIESVHKYKARSHIVSHVITYGAWPFIEVRLRIQWNETLHRLKLAVPTIFKEGAVVCEIPGGQIERPQDGREHVHGRWFMMQGDIQGKALGLAVVHNGQHGFDAVSGEIGLSVLRSPAYCHERRFNLAGQERAYMDQGVHAARYYVTAGDPGLLRKELSNMADLLDAPPLAYAHLPFGSFEKNNIKQRKEIGIPTLLRSGVRMTACKRSFEGDALILRLHEISGERAKVRITLKPNLQHADILLKSFEIKTLRFEKDGAWCEVDPISERG
jgi:alpha-mannosidase